MNKSLVTILLFAQLILFILSPFAALASLMLGLVMAAFVGTLWTLLHTLVSGNPNRDPKLQNK